MGMDLSLVYSVADARISDCFAQRNGKFNFVFLSSTQHQSDFLLLFLWARGQTPHSLYLL